jgi:hypothetical protein
MKPEKKAILLTSSAIAMWWVMVLVLLITRVAHCEPAGILTWTADPSVAYCIAYPSCSIQLAPDTQGISSFFSNNPLSWGDPLQWEITRAFEVTSPGAFLFSDVISMTGYGSPSSPSGYEPLQVSFTGNGVSASGQEIPGTSTWSLWTPLTITGEGSDVQVLGVGDYLLVQSLNADVTAANTASMQVSFVSEVTGVDPPDVVPEPNLLGSVLVMLGLMVIGVFGLKRKGNYE